MPASANRIGITESARPSATDHTTTNESAVSPALPMAASSPPSGLKATRFQNLVGSPDGASTWSSVTTSSGSTLHSWNGTSPTS